MAWTAEQVDGLDLSKFSYNILEATGVLLNMGVHATYAKLCGVWFHLLPTRGTDGYLWCLFKATDEQQRLISEYQHAIEQQETDNPDQQV